MGKDVFCVQCSDRRRRERTENGQLFDFAHSHSHFHNSYPYPRGALHRMLDDRCWMLDDNQGTVIITQNGEAKVVVQNIQVYEETQESLALLKLLAQSSSNLDKGKFKPADKSFSDLRKRIGKSNR